MEVILLAAAVQSVYEDLFEYEYKYVLYCIVLYCGTEQFIITICAVRLQEVDTR